MKSDCTILTVCYNDALLFKENIQLIQALNPDTLIDFLVVNNSKKEEERIILEQSAHVIDGCDAPSHAPDRGSTHHAHALAKGVEHVSTRYLIIIDPDFFVIKHNWIDYCIQQMDKKDLGVIASVWNPRWTIQPRYVPTIHFLCIDLNKLPKQELNFLPSRHRQYLFNLISNIGILKRIKRRLIQGQLKDTAWKLPLAIKKYSLGKGLLTPVYNPSEYESARTIKIDTWIPERFSITPKIKNYYKETGFLQKTHGIDAGWEEFYLNNKPFGFHMRRVGVAHATRNETMAEQITLLYKHLREQLR